MLVKHGVVVFARVAPRDVDGFAGFDATRRSDAGGDVRGPTTRASAKIEADGIFRYFVPRKYIEIRLKSREALLLSRPGLIESSPLVAETVDDIGSLCGVLHGAEGIEETDMAS